MKKGTHHTKETKERMFKAAQLRLLLYPENFLGRPHTEESKLKMSKAKMGKRRFKETKEKISKTLTGRYVGKKNPFYGKHHSEETKAKWSASGQRSHLGASNGRWKGGIYPLVCCLRQVEEYLQWRALVFERDNYTCQKCKKMGRKLEAHHKKPLSKILENFLKEYDQFSPIDDKETLIRLAIKYKPFWDISNGETLCKRCHLKLEAYIRQSNVGI